MELRAFLGHHDLSSELRSDFCRSVNPAPDLLTVLWISDCVLWVISGFRREVVENCALLGYYEAGSGNSLPTFRDKLLDSSSRIKNPKISELWRRGRQVVPKRRRGIFNTRCVITKKSEILTFYMVCYKVSSFKPLQDYMTLYIQLYYPWHGVQIWVNEKIELFIMAISQMCNLSSIYFVTQPLHVSGMFTAHHQEVFTVYVQKLVRVIGLCWLAAGRVRMEPDPSQPGQQPVNLNV
jgi:hypothetical protein